MQNNLKNIFIKTSGDLFDSPSFIEEVRNITLDAKKVVICVGGGRQINQMFRELGTGEDTLPHGPLGRELETTEQKDRANIVLEKNKKQLEEILISQKIEADIIIPVLNISGVMCHINGDQMVRALYIGFDELYVFTTKERLEKKESEFFDLPKVRVRGIERG